MLRTMELVLGLKPMSQFDAAARPMYNAFLPKADTTPYKARAAGTDLGELNTAKAWGAKDGFIPARAMANPMASPTFEAKVA